MIHSLKREENLRTHVKTLALAAALSALAGGALAQAVTTLRINRSPVGQFQGLIIAQEQGYFAERGIAVELAIGTSPDAAIAELLSGQTQIAMTGGVPLAAAVANGAPVVAVFPGQNDGTIPTHGLLVMADSPVQTIADLRGQTIGIPGIASPQGLYLLDALAAAGMTRDDVELVNLPFPGVTEAIQAGSVAAGVPIGLFYDFGVAGGLREVPGYSEQVLLDTPAVFFAANREWADANAEVLGKFIEAMQLAHEWANANPDEVRRIDVENTRLPPDYLMSRPFGGLDTTFHVGPWMQQVEGLARYGFISRAVTAEEMIWSGAPTE